MLLLPSLQKKNLIDQRNQILELVSRCSLHLLTPTETSPLTTLLPSHFHIPVTLSSLKLPNLFSFDAFKIFYGFKRYDYDVPWCSPLHASSAGILEFLRFVGLQISPNLEIFLPLFLQYLPPHLHALYFYLSLHLLGH